MAAQVQTLEKAQGCSSLTKPKKYFSRLNKAFSGGLKF